MTEPGYRHFAVRRVNPFEGVLEVLETDHARAYSPNGRVWQVQVLAQRPDHTWRSFSDRPAVEQFFNFGLWDADAGLHRIPANPVMDIGGMTAAADRLVVALEQASAQLPFPLADNYECWSVDDDGHPVALLATSEERDRLAAIRISPWLATRLADPGFVAPSLLAQGVAADGESGPRQHAVQLEQQVHALAAQQAWFRRDADGSGQRLQPGGSSGTLQPAAFPRLGLKSDWGDEQTAALAHDYLEWSAPRLLMLQHLSTQERSWLEAAACRQAAELANAYRLYPEVIDPARIEAARVEARLRRSA
jgi:hypothetical protein